MNTLILSWLPSQENDEMYPLKEVVILNNEPGYSKTEWSMTREEIIERNEVSGISEKDRHIADILAMRGS